MYVTARCSGTDITGCLPPDCRSLQLSAAQIATSAQEGRWGSLGRKTVSTGTAGQSGSVLLAFSRCLCVRLVGVPVHSHPFLAPGLRAQLVSAVSNRAGSWNICPSPSFSSIPTRLPSLSVSPFPPARSERQSWAGARNVLGAGVLMRGNAPSLAALPTRLAPSCGFSLPTGHTRRRRCRRRHQ